MSLITKAINKTISEITKEQLDGASKIIEYVMANNTLLTKIEIPYSVKSIDGFAFDGCSALEEIDTDEMDPYCIIKSAAFSDTAWSNNLKTNSMHYFSNGRILAACTITTPSTDLIIPDTVLNISGMAFSNMPADSNFTSMVIPDAVEIMCGIPPTTVTKVTIGAGVRYLNQGIFNSTQYTTLIFRQPAGMEIILPIAGNGSGLAYNKNSKSINIYTDNEYIKNYDWATDNVTATFYPLADAPV